MGRSSPTRLLVRQFATAMLLAGRLPTQSALRDLISEASGLKPSPHTVGGALSQFWDELLPRIAPLLSPPSDFGYSDDTPFSLDSLVEIESASRALEGRAGDLEELTRLQYDNRELRVTVMQQGERILSLTHELAEKSQLLNSAVATAGDALSRTKAAERRVIEAEILAKDAQQRLNVGISQLRQELMADADRARKEFEVERDALKENQAALEGTRRHLMMETDKMRTNSEYQIKSIRVQLADAQFREQQYLVQKNAAIEEAGRLREQVEQLLEKGGARDPLPEDVGARSSSNVRSLTLSGGARPEALPNGASSFGLSLSDDPDGLEAE